MISNWLTLRDLEYVLAVASHEHFGRAAKECHVSQPSLSAQIKKIESCLGAQLFERTNRRVSVTSVGVKVVEQARVILDEAEKIPDLIGQTNSRELRNLKLGLILSMAPLVPFVLPEIKKAFPSVSLTLHESLTDELIGRLKRGALDAVIAADDVQDPSLKKIPLYFERFVLAAPKGHPILTRSKPRARDLKVSEMVLLEEGHCLREQALHLCAVNRRGNPREFHATNIETLRHLVATGAGYTLLPILATKGNPMSDLISYVSFENEKIGRKIVLYIQNRASVNTLVQSVAEILIKKSPKDVQVFS